MVGTAGTGVTASSLLSSDKDMLGAEKASRQAWNKSCNGYVDTSYEATHNHDEYHFVLDEIEHDPYVLISIFVRAARRCLHWPRCRANLKMFLEKAVHLTETVTMQIRYCTK